MPQISQAVKLDHKLVRDAYSQLLNTKPEERGSPNEFIWDLYRYLIVEDLVMTPALDNHVAGGGERHRRLSDDHESINGKLRHMQLFSPDSASFEAALRAIWIDLEPHIREEATATGDLARLEEGMSRAASEALGRKYDNIKGLLQKPYGNDGVPDAETLAALLAMPRQELMVRIGVPASA
ncbi:hypothetical protein QBC39DRAFT_399895 [Podospora conica]|nr:hypothetical protein QBC39DRAFT_399895 [Schizothecium conicum]